MTRYADAYMRQQARTSRFQRSAVTHDIFHGHGHITGYIISTLWYVYAAKDWIISDILISMV